ncbi:hypothetical protein ACTXT7_011807 [Hymenolepis weldensis]
MNASGSKQDLLWNVPIDTPTSDTVTAVTTTNTSPLSEGDSEGPQKSILSSPTSTADLLSISASASMFLSDFARFPFPLPPLADLYNLSTNPMASLLLAQVGAAALNSLNQNIPTLSPFIEGPEQGSPRNTFSIAEHIREEVKEGENGEEKEEERETTNVERSRSNNESLFAEQKKHFTLTSLVKSYLPCAKLILKDKGSVTVPMESNIKRTYLTLKSVRSELRQDLKFVKDPIKRKWVLSQLM